MEEKGCERPVIRVRQLLSEEAADLGLAVRAGTDGLDKEIFIPRIQKPGLALAGFMEYIHAGRVQILGQSEITFLGNVDSDKRRAILEDLCARGASCFVITKGLTPPPELLAVSDRCAVPLLTTRVVSSELIEGISRFLEDQLAPRLTRHGVLLDIHGVGVLLLGESGIGKSECALDLVVRGHRLVSDDAVEIRRKGKTLNGTSPEMSVHHMEIRGLGLINIKELFGVAAVRSQMNLDLVVRLDRWKAGKEYDRLGLEEKTHDILGVQLQFIEMPVAPGRNLAVLIEVAARNHLLRRKGYIPARDLAERLQARLSGGTPNEG